MRLLMKLAKKLENIILDVFSSFKLYGWEQRDEQYRDLFDKLDMLILKSISWHEADNDEIREYLEKQQISLHILRSGQRPLVFV
jgi:hypothetical protein